MSNGRIERRVLIAAFLATASAITSLWSAAPGSAPAVFAQPGGFGPQVDVRAVAQKTVARPGDQLAIAIALEHGDGFHTWPNDAQVTVPAEFGTGFEPIPTAIEVVAVPEGATVHPIVWPAPIDVPVNYTGIPVMLPSFAHTAVAYLPVQISPDAAPGAMEFDLSVTFQACDETTCFAPETTTFRVAMNVDAAASPAQPLDPTLFAGFDPAAVAWNAGGGGGSNAALSACRAGQDRITFNVFGWTPSLNPCGTVGFAILLLVAAFGGLLLNFTPCVLPVIPLKIMGLSRAAGNPGRLIGLGFAMAIGVVAFWLAIGAAIAFIAGFGAINALFQTGWFSIVVGLIVGVMALGMLGLFTFSVPQAVYRINPSHDTPQGSFLFGVLTAVLSTPCTAPFMGGAAAWAATQSPAITLTTFAAIGAGMALPYLVLTMRPALIQKVPRSGPASEVVKQVMGIMMLAVAAFFLGIPIASALNTPPDPVSRTYWWAVAFFIVLAMGWLTYRTLALTDSTRRRAAFIVPAAVLAFGIIFAVRDLSSHGPIDWVYYTPERFASAQAEGNVVVLVFTAEWCLNCKALESGVLNRDEIVQLFESPGVIPMRVDMTNDNEFGQAKLAELNWYGIPLLAVFGPGLSAEAPLMFDTYTQQMVKDAVAAARQ